MHALTIFNLYSRRSIAALALVVALCVFAYGGLLLGAVAHAAHRSDAERQIKALSAQVSELEGRYLTQTRALSPEAAHALGFVPPVSVTTVFAPSNALTLAGQALAPSELK